MNLKTIYSLKDVTPELLSLITGKLLGDGSITIQKGRRPRFQFMHRIEDRDWCFYCYHQLKDLIPLNPPKYKSVYDERLIKGYSESYYVQSKTHGLITLLEKIWYTNRKKSLPLSLLHYLLDETCLAWWYQDDGHLMIENNIPRKIILSTESFSPNENDQLIKLLEDRFSLSFSRDGQNRLVLYDQLQIYYFFHLVKRNMCLGMERKLPQIYTQKSISNYRRTSLYLPSNFYITKPTKEINDSFKSLDYILTKIEANYKSFYIKRIMPIKRIKQTKSYQIFIPSDYISKLELIKNLTGLNYSQSATLCFLMFDKNSKLM